MAVGDDESDTAQAAGKEVIEEVPLVDSASDSMIQVPDKVPVLNSTACSSIRTISSRASTHRRWANGGVLQCMYTHQGGDG